MNYKKAFNEISQYYFTVSLVILNIVIFLICTFTGNMLYNEGAFYVFGVMTDKEAAALKIGGEVLCYVY